ncbi:hypothetical protein FHR83_003979 [Actinoplanes campanulatus]|uniref:Uncharacterized protein n=1 Tax=Actinoplanes campanulatus TaxID=113559 RepID=A0A7W5FFA9_9ACTN|nr:DUF5994 family protein [Actinoplanes campanulatus]MBB3096309.1 hypothetical protein [Actinoplanes campanulatus]GGN19196.1 hypothetical protein GCM10010109_32610 [Actinoplanes campanulatus]GID41599.1 hypothetical protein Aca09nite_81050 [Actinoplanes campanulatus]
MSVDGTWWPSSPDLATELWHLVRALDQVRGPVTRLLLAVGTWTTEPHRIVMGGRMVTIGYRTRRPTTLITVICGDGGSFSVCLAPQGPAPGPGETAWDKATWEAGRGGCGALREEEAR